MKSDTIESSELYLSIDETEKNSQYFNIIKDTMSGLSNIEDNLLKSLDEYEKKISKEYDNYIKKLEKQATNIITLTEESTKDKERQKLEYGKTLNYLEEVYETNLNFTNVIISAINNYSLFLNENVPFYKDPSTYFLIKNSKDLIECNYFRKINEKTLNQLNSRITFCNLLGDITNKNQLKTVYINSTKDTISGKCLLDSNDQPKINDLIISKINDYDFNYLFEEYNCDDKKQIKKIIFNNCNFNDINLANISYDIQNFTLRNSNFIPSCLKTLKFQNLNYLCLEGINLISDNFENLIEILSENFNENYMGRNLKYLSVKDNHISRIINDNKLDEILERQKKFEELTEINFENNNIYKINAKFFEIAPKLKLVNLINNNLNFLFKCKNMIENCCGTILLNKNINIINNNIFNDYYLDYYIKCLNNPNNKNIFNHMNFEGLFNKLNQPNLLKLNLKSCFNTNKIVEINFSDNGIEDENMLKLFKNILVLTNLEKLNLSNNNLTEKFLEKLISEKIFEKCKNLKHCDYSNNNIQFKKDIVINLIKILPQLEFLIMKFTPLEVKFSEYMKKEVNIYYEKKIKHEQKTVIEQEYKDIQEIIEHGNLNLNPSFKLIICDLIKSKYTEKIKKLFPNILTNIQLVEY